jgi:hypothetical protein
MMTIAILSALVILLFRFDADSNGESNDSAVAGGGDPGHHARRHGLNQPTSTPPATA